jgi:regulator of sigma D
MGMGKKITRNGDHWRAVDSLLQRWLGDRQLLLSLLCELGTVVRNGVHRAGARQKLDRFCEVLVDYVSAGHFEIYCALLDEGERFGAKRCREAADLYARIVPTTAVALDFNDHYFNGGSGRALEQDLSTLGQMLASRFDWEDALIRRLHMAGRAVA